MFIRSNQSYQMDENALHGILNDEANSLNRISLVVEKNSKIMDIGAGNGILSRIIKYKYPNIIIDGIEPSVFAANLAKPFYRNFYVGNAEDYLEIIKNGKYDYLIMADVIEHLSDPFTFLERLTAVISSDCKIILSVPNIAFGSARLVNLNGEFDYTDSGLIERTHLRFFTLKTLEELITNVGVHIEKLFLQQRSFFQNEFKIERFKLNPFLLRKITKDSLSYTYQFLVVLSKKTCKREVIITGKKDKFLYLRYLRKRINLHF